MMTRLCGNSKVKRVVAWLILVSIVMTSFITSTTETVYADSNSRRRTSINLAAGVGFGDISNFDDIDDISLQTIAVYLSNFYLPFVTILDGDYTKENAEDSGNVQHVEAMKDALIRNCGFKKEVAEYLVSYVLSQSLASCKVLYMKTSELIKFFDAHCYSGNKSYLGFGNFRDLYGGSGHVIHGLSAFNEYSADSSMYYTKAITKAGGWFSKEEYGAWDYVSNAGTINFGGDDYTPVSYAIFLGVMQNMRRTNWGYDSVNPNIFWAEFGTAVSGETKFYAFTTTDSGATTMQPVFSNKSACLSALLQALQFCDTANGFSTGFSSVTATDVETIKNPEVTQYALAPAPNMYVNWEGSLVYDNGMYRTVVLPGCMNPYMVERFTSGGEYQTQNFINNISITSISNEYSTTSKKSSMSSGQVINYRVTIGSDNYKFDASWMPGSWGENDGIFDLVQSMEYLGVTGTAGGDAARFPIISERLSDYSIGESPGDNNKFYSTSYGTGSSSQEIVWYDNFAPVTAETQLNTFFPRSNVFDMVEALKEYNLDSYAQFKNIKLQGHAFSYPASTKRLFQNIYLTYCFAAFNSEYGTWQDDATNIVQMKLNFDNFPRGNVDMTWESIQQDLLANEILSFIYYLLHPTEGIGYVATLFKNKISGILLAWHEDIVGATSSNAATGMTKYLGTSSYTTMPNLKDISWVAGILNIYNNIVVYLIILMTLVLLCYVLTGTMTIQRGIVGVLLFGICAFMPPIAINAAVDTINTTSDMIFSRKFDYWAICQMQNFINSYQEAMEAQGSGDFINYAAFVLSSQQSDISLQSDDSASAITYSGAKVKWMAPKKYNSLSSLVQAVNEGTAMGNSSASFLKNTLLTMVAKSTSGETYLDDSDALYLYRDYSDIFKYAHSTYNILGTFNYDERLGRTGSMNYQQDRFPLDIYTNDTVSSYTKAWYSEPGNPGTIGNPDVYSFITSNMHNQLNTSDAATETSSLMYIAKGYLYDTISYNPSDTTHTYMYDGGVAVTFMTKGGWISPVYTMAVSYLANYTQTYREVANGYAKLQEVVAGTKAVEVGTPTSPYYNFGLPKATKDSENYNGSYLWGYQEIIGLEDADIDTEIGDDADKQLKAYKNISDIFYGIYTESPFFYFNFVVRDQANATNLGDAVEDNYRYNFKNLARGGLGVEDNKWGDDPGSTTPEPDPTTPDPATPDPTTPTEDPIEAASNSGYINHIAKMFLKDNQAYFFNLTDDAGDGWGELRDFTNMHDLFYFVIPYLRDGVELARLYDNVFGLYTDDDCSLIVNANGSCLYDGQEFKDLQELEDILSDPSNSYTDEEKYKLWHTYNTYTILSAYTPWIDTMMDCEYSKPEYIRVMGDRFRVTDPLDPRTYYRVDPSTGKVAAGRYMIFSKSEMNAMGLNINDLTTVERKILDFQENVYQQTINLMNYYTFSDEVLIQAYAMLQTFEFNKLFSQTSLWKEDYVMYPQGYELKAFSYDAYLRMVVSNASGESLMFNGKKGGNESIYGRVMKNTSLFFGIFLLINDVLAVYVIPGLKIFFLIIIFFCSVLILIGSVVKMEMNIVTVLWKSLFAPLLGFSAVSIGMSLIVSMFMANGANGVASSEFVIKVGDPTAAIILMIVVNVVVVVLMFKICKKCFRDFVTYAKAVFDNIGSTVVGAVGGLAAGLATGRAMDRFRSRGSSGGNSISRTARQRGHDNDPRSGRNGVASALGAGAAGGAVAALPAGGMAAGEQYDAMSAREKRAFHESKNRAEDTAGMNKYDKKAYDGATQKLDIARDKAERDKALAENATGLRKKRLELAQKIHQRQADSASIKADNIKKYGTGAKSRIEGLKAMGGKGRQSRLDSINNANNARVQEREKRAKAALASRDRAKAQAVTDTGRGGNARVRSQARGANRGVVGKKGGKQPLKKNKSGAEAKANQFMANRRRAATQRAGAQMTGTRGMQSPAGGRLRGGGSPAAGRRAGGGPQMPKGGGAKAPKGGGGKPKMPKMPKK